MPRRAYDWISSYFRWIARWRWPVLLACVLVTAGAASGLRHLAFTADFRVYFGEKNPELLAYRALENIYTKTDNILFVIQPKKGDVFNRDILAVVERLTKESWRLPNAIRVDSLTNFQHTEAKGDELIVGDLVADAGKLSDARLAAVRRAALAEPALLDRLIAPDGRTTGVLVTFQFPGSEHTDHLRATVLRAQAMAADLRARRPDLTVALTGLVIMSYTETQVSEKDMSTIMPIMGGLIVLITLVLLRSWVATVATVSIAVLSAAAAAGISAWLSMKMSPATAIAPIVILTLAIADSVHILMTAMDEMRQGRRQHDAVAESLRLNAEPVFLTSLTTFIGFSSLNFSDSPPFRDLGNIAALGVLLAWILSMTFLPALLAVLPLRVRPRRAGLRLPMDRFGDFVVGRRTILLWLMGGATLLAVAFIPRLQIDDRFVEWFGPAMQFRIDTDFATKNLVGPYSLEFSVGSGQPGGISDPAYLERLEAFSAWLHKLPDVTHVNTYTDIMKRVNKSMHGDDPAWYRLPDRRELAAQYLLLYELSLPFGLDLNSLINVDKSATRLTVTLRTVPTRRMHEIAARAEAWLQANAPPAMRARATGASIMFAYLTERNIRGMLGGTALAFLLISLTLIFALRSVRLGLISLLSNFVPVLVTFGLWSAFVGYIGIIASIITATSMGLIVDDTVHILSKYRRAKLEHRLGSHDAIRFSFSHVGKALWSTTIILLAGFSALTISDFKGSSELGLLTAIAVAAALVVDFLLLPPLLMILDRDPRCACVTCRPALSAKA